MTTPTYDDFASHLDTEFHISGDAGAIKAILIEAIKGLPREEGAPPPFSVIFLGPLEPELPQGMHTLSHPQIGDLDVFLVPIARDEEGMRYETVFASWPG